MKGTKKEIETFKKMVNDLDMASMSIDNHEEMKLIISNFKMLSEFIEEV